MKFQKDDVRLIPPEAAYLTSSKKNISATLPQLPVIAMVMVSRGT